ncbi:MAG: class I SAM-dependent methyltransferase [Candidatus Diapherotrites archaeon]|nr:class I SAM-dependent methyltransferase [Candidatus Diapherotrites archaeon]
MKRRESIQGKTALDFHSDNKSNLERYDEFLDVVLSYAKKLNKPNPTIIDLGCGSGETELLLTKKLPYATIIGIDNSKTMIKLAKRLLKDCPRMKIYYKDINKLKPDFLHGDLIISRHTFHRLNELKKGFLTMSRLANKNAFLINNSFVNLKSLSVKEFEKWIDCFIERNNAPLNQKEWVLAHFNAPSVKEYVKAIKSVKSLKLIKIIVNDEGYGCNTIKTIASKK